MDRQVDGGRAGRIHGPGSQQGQGASGYAAAPVVGMGPVSNLGPSLRRIRDPDVDDSDGLRRGAPADAV